MNNRTGFLLCSTAAAALLTFSASGQAATPASSPVVGAQSYGELLEPIPNATAMLIVDDAARAQQPARLQLAQYHHHHHHHHHGFFPGAVIGGVIGGLLAPPPPVYYGPNCYWTRGRPYWNGWRWVHPRVRVCE